MLKAKDSRCTSWGPYIYRPPGEIMRSYPRYIQPSRGIALRYGARGECRVSAVALPRLINPNTKSPPITHIFCFYRVRRDRLCFLTPKCFFFFFPFSCVCSLSLFVWRLHFIELSIIPCPTHKVQTGLLTLNKNIFH